MSNEEMGTPSILYFNEIWHACRCHQKIKNAKKFFETPIICGVMFTFINAIFTHYASMNMLNFLLNSQFLSL